MGKEPFMNAVKQAEKARTGINAEYVCPHCGKTEHTPNAETLAAMQEGEAILRGEIPSAVFIDPRQYQTREELKTALKEAL
jgi:hypothetical protein